MMSHKLLRNLLAYYIEDAAFGIRSAYEIILPILTNIRGERFIDISGTQHNAVSRNKTPLDLQVQGILRVTRGESSPAALNSVLFPGIPKVQAKHIYGTSHTEKWLAD